MKKIYIDYNQRLNFVNESSAIDFKKGFTQKKYLQGV